MASTKKKFYVFPPDESNSRYYLDEIEFGTSNDDLPDEWTECSIEFVGNTKVKINFDETTTVCVVVTNDAKDIIKSNIFAMEFERKNDDYVSAKLYISFPLSNFDKKFGNVIQTLFSRIFDIQMPEANATNQQAQPLGIDELYRRSTSYEKCSVPELHVQHDCLKPRLRPYQERAVQWMIQRENEHENKEVLHPLFEEIQLNNGERIYFNKYTGYVEDRKPVAPSLMSGGILADEMGLGKTVEILACILCHPKPEESNQMRTESTNAYSGFQGNPIVHKQPQKRKQRLDDDLEGSSTSSKGLTIECICGKQHSRGSVQCVGCTTYQHKSCLGYEDAYGEYRCPKCWMKLPLLESKGTLIVTPVTLHQQWREEIRKHLRSRLKVLIYEGSRAIAVYPTKLQDYDIVLTTYTVLKEELRYLECQKDDKTVTLRTQSRYTGPGSPFAMIKWWRLCLDEAQEVETPKHKISIMAKELKAHHRWAVTGTPISREVSGLYGLIDYLQLEPYNEKDTWNHLLLDPYLSGNFDPMVQFLAKVMWRSFKDDVIDEMHIPAQTIKIYPKEFSAVEKYFYKREHELCEKRFMNELSGYNSNDLLRTLDKKRYEKLMAPLLSIRKACSHPSATKGSYLANRKRVTSMDSLMDALIRKNNTEINKLLKIIVPALNDLGDIYLLQNPKQAEDAYNDIIKLDNMFKNANDFKVLEYEIDTLELLHAFHNLSITLEALPHAESTVRSQNLRETCLQLEAKLMRSFSDRSLMSFQNMTAATNSVSELQRESTQGQWYTSLLEWVVDNDFMAVFQKRIQTVWENSGNPKLDISNKEKLQHLITTWDAAVACSQATVKSFLTQIFYISNDDDLVIVEELIEAAMNCHLYSETASTHLKKCNFCNATDEVRQYEALLHNSSFVGSRKPTSQELALEVLLKFAESKKPTDEIINDGKLHFKILDARKKELQQIATFLDNLNEQIRNQCDIKASYKRRSKNSDPNELIKVVEQNKKELKSKLEQRKFLQGCHRRQQAGQRNPCSTCNETLDDQYGILMCGHCYCLGCILRLNEEAKNSIIVCSGCKESQKVEDVSYVGMEDETNNQKKYKIKGNYSSKIEAIVELILKLKYEDDDVKILVFSTWRDALKHLEHALKFNGIEVKLPPRNLEPSLIKFRNNGGETVLLLPIDLGSKGLNLIEATHVILVEPVLNPADELQAIGRIHRIGQTRATVVHKFIMKNTIEETLYRATSSNADAWNNDNITVQHLKNLFTKTAEDQPSLDSDEDTPDSAQRQPVQNENSYDVKSSVSIKHENSITAPIQHRLAVDGNEDQDVKPTISTKSEETTIEPVALTLDDYDELIEYSEMKPDIKIENICDGSIICIDDDDDDDVPASPPKSVKTDPDEFKPVPSTSRSSFPMSRKRQHSELEEDDRAPKLQMIDKEHAAFGLHVAELLRELTPHMALHVKQRISEVIFEALKNDAE